MEQRQRFVTLDLTISVHLIDHVLEFSLGGVLSQRAHDSSKLFGGDGAIAVLVKQWERLLELWELTQVEASVLGTWLWAMVVQKERWDERWEETTAKRNKPLHQTKVFLLEISKNTNSTNYFYNHLSWKSV